MIEIELPEEVENIFAKLAAKKGHSMNYFARKAIMELVEDMEDVDECEEIMKNSTGAYTMEEAKAYLGLEN